MPKDSCTLVAEAANRYGREDKGKQAKEIIDRLESLKTIISPKAQLELEALISKAQAAMDELRAQPVRLPYVTASVLYFQTIATVERGQFVPKYKIAAQAAIITEVTSPEDPESLVALKVFPPYGSVQTVVAAKFGKDPGCWQWPPADK